MLSHRIPQPLYLPFRLQGRVEEAGLQLLSTLRNLKELSLFGHHVDGERFPDFWSQLTGLTALRLRCWTPIPRLLLSGQMPGLRCLEMETGPRFKAGLCADTLLSLVESLPKLSSLTIYVLSAAPRDELKLLKAEGLRVQQLRPGLEIKVV